MNAHSVSYGCHRPNSAELYERHSSPMIRFEKAAVLGAGTMGAQIAAHLANAGVPVLLLDIAPRELTPEEQARGLPLDSREVRDRVARAGRSEEHTSELQSRFGI